MSKLQNRVPLNHFDPEPDFAVISASAAAGNTAVVPAQAGKHIRVLLHCWTTDGDAEKVAFRSGDTTVIAGPFNCPTAGDGMSPVFSEGGHFQTAAGEALNLHQLTGVGVNGYLVYILVDPS